MYFRCYCNHCFLWNHCLQYSGLCCGKEKKIFCINLVFGCISPGLRIFKDILGVWLRLNSKNRTVGEPGVGWIFCKVYSFNLPSKLFLCLLAYLSMIIHEEFVVHTVSAKCSSPHCVYRCWTCLVGFSCSSHRHTWPCYEGSISNLRYSHTLHTLSFRLGQNTHSSRCATYFFISFLRHVFLYLEIRISLFYLKPDVLYTWLRSLVTHTGNSGCEELKI